ncbi:hypothetical protein B0H13DRAFT_2343801 [Mycena leptocephala]|nr:hypothetical protein B0H13DRAFT_2343801 [Mycena leptocephala]
MNDDTHLDAHIMSKYTATEGPLHRATYVGAFFPRSRNLAITGGVFTSNVTHIHNSTPPGPVGDLNLRHEIGMDSGSDTVFWRNGRGSVRKMYSARIQGCDSPMTVAVYLGDTAEEEWWEDIVKYQRLRHPHIVQLFGTVKSSGLHAAVYHDDLVLASQMIKRYRVSLSPLRVVIFCLSMEAEFTKANDYLLSVLGRAQSAPECTVWIRPSTDGVSVEFSRCLSQRLHIFKYPRLGAVTSSLDAHEDSEIIDSLAFDDYHHICDWYLGEFRSFSLYAHHLVKPGTIYRWPQRSKFEDAPEIAYSSETETYAGNWDISGLCSDEWCVLIENGWTRVDASAVAAAGKYLGCRMLAMGDSKRWWFTQANHLFHRLGITSEYEDYVLFMEFFISVPPSDLQEGISRAPFHASECPAYYWSLDPKGVQRLNTEEATNLGLPSITVKIEVEGYSWDRTLYDGLRRFHQGKGFDPESQQLAHHLSYPLYKQSHGCNPLFAHVDGDSTDEDEDASGHQVPIHRDLDFMSESTWMNDDLMNYVEDPVGVTLDTQMPAPSLGWKLLMLVTFGLILALGLSRLCEREGGRDSGSG